MKYAIIFGKGDSRYGAYVPDLPGCVAVGENLEEVKRSVREAIAFHLMGLGEEGPPIREPTPLGNYVEAEV